MTNAQRTIDLQQGILYGPVRSRRFGLSLGLNILPQEIKVCSFNCRYCQYSWTGMPATQPALFERLLPSRTAVREALQNKLASLRRAGTPPETLTFSGNGEATLHPDFAGIAEDVVALRDSHAPRCRTAILSNASTAHRPDVREALLRLDDAVLKLDAGREETFLKLNRPARGVEFGLVVDGLRAMGRNAVLQSLFVKGSLDNSTDDEVEAWVEVVHSIGPREVQVYTLDRGPADKGLLAVPARRLRTIAARVRSRAGVPAKVYD